MSYCYHYYYQSTGNFVQIPSIVPGHIWCHHISSWIILSFFTFKGKERLSSLMVVSMKSGGDFCWLGYPTKRKTRISYSILSIIFSFLVVINLIRILKLFCHSTLHHRNMNIKWCNTMFRWKNDMWCTWSSLMTMQSDEPENLVPCSFFFSPVSNVGASSLRNAVA